ncbi:hypothetical protein J6590_048037, partial [Homalodisca vitripennis]
MQLGITQNPCTEHSKRQKNCPHLFKKTSTSYHEELASTMQQKTRKLDSQVDKGPTRVVGIGT